MKTDIFSIPYDYPYKRRFQYCSGAAYVLSLDSIDYVVTGAQYEPYFNCAEDLMAGYILNKVGIHPINMGTKHCAFFITNLIVDADS